MRDCLWCVRLTDAEHFLGFSNRRRQCVDLFGRVVKVKTCAYGGRGLESQVQWHGTVMPCANRDPLLVEQDGNILWRNSLNHKADHAGAVIGIGTENPQSVDLRNHSVRRFHQFVLSLLEQIVINLLDELKPPPDREK